MTRRPVSTQPQPTTSVRTRLDTECTHVGVTGARGFVGWHVSSHVFARRGDKIYRGETPTHALVQGDRGTFASPEALRAFVASSDVIVHCAGVNRGSDSDVEDGNVDLARRLADAYRATRSSATVVFVDSIHVEASHPRSGSAYARGKRRAAEILRAACEAGGGHLVDLIVPNVFGEHARPHYNNVTATFCRHLLEGTAPSIDRGATVELVHASDVVHALFDAIVERPKVRRLTGRVVDVASLFERLSGMHRNLAHGIFPNLSDRFTLHLYNTYRAAGVPGALCRPLRVHADMRGELFEAAKGGGGGQTFVSTTHPGVTRGGHFHLEKAERFVVLQGKARIRLRRVLHDDVHEFLVDGDEPTAVDIPTLHTHAIDNVGDSTLLTLFWAHEIFDPTRPDAYPDPVSSA